MNKLIKKKIKKKTQTKFDTLRDVELLKCYKALSEMKPESEEYAETLKRIEELGHINKKKDREKVNPNTVIGALAPMLPVITILVYEGAGNVVKTKALQFVTKLKL